MKHFNSIKKSRDFKEVYQSGKSLANKLLVMYIRKTDRPETRIGISVSRKVGNSVVRHHITRLIRESFRLHEDIGRDRIRHRSRCKSSGKGRRLQNNRKCISALVRTS